MNIPKCDKDGNYPENKSYKEIHKLDNLLTEADIPHTMRRIYDGWQIFYYSPENCAADVVQHFGSYGSHRDLLEIMGLCDESVEGFLSAQEVFERIKCHYKKSKSSEVTE